MGQYGYPVTLIAKDLIPTHDHPSILANHHPVKVVTDAVAGEHNISIFAQVQPCARIIKYVLKNIALTRTHCPNAMTQIFTEGIASDHGFGITH